MDHLLMLLLGLAVDLLHGVFALGVALAAALGLVIGGTVMVAVLALRQRRTPEPPAIRPGAAATSTRSRELPSVLRARQRRRRRLALAALALALGLVAAVVVEAPALVRWGLVRECRARGWDCACSGVTVEWLTGTVTVAGMQVERAGGAGAGGSLMITQAAVTLRPWAVLGPVRTVDRVAFSGVRGNLALALGEGLPAATAMSAGGDETARIGAPDATAPRASAAGASAADPRAPAAPANPTDAGSAARPAGEAPAGGAPAGGALVITRVSVRDLAVGLDLAASGMPVRRIPVTIIDCEAGPLRSRWWLRDVLLATSLSGTIDSAPLNMQAIADASGPATATTVTLEQLPAADLAPLLGRAPACFSAGSLDLQAEVVDQAGMVGITCRLAGHQLILAPDPGADLGPRLAALALARVLAAGQGGFALQFSTATPEERFHDLRSFADLGLREQAVQVALEALASQAGISPAGTQAIEQAAERLRAAWRRWRQ